MIVWTKLRLDLKLLLCIMTWRGFSPSTFTFNGTSLQLWSHLVQYHQSGGPISQEQFSIKSVMWLHTYKRRMNLWCNNYDKRVRCTMSRWILDHVGLACHRADIIMQRTTIELAIFYALYKAQYAHAHNICMTIMYRDYPRRGLCSAHFSTRKILLTFSWLT